MLGLQCLLFCFLPPFLINDAKAKVYPIRIAELLKNRWFPAMNHISEFAGLSENEIEELTEQVLLYIRVGRS